MGTKLPKMSKEAQMMEAILAGKRYPVLETEEEFARVAGFTLAALSVMDVTRHENFNIGAWQCGYDDAIIEGMYDFESMTCHCPECKAQYGLGYVEGMKLTGGDPAIPEQKDAVRELDEAAQLFQLICMYPRYVAEEKPDGADKSVYLFALEAAQAMAEG